MIVHVIGGGLAGSEAAWQLARFGVKVFLHEMRPQRLTEAHRTAGLAELVCSNSLRSDDPVSPSGILKRELEVAGSLIMGSARKHSVPAGSSLAVDRERFSSFITEKLQENPSVEIIREEVADLPEGVCIIATGPLTSERMVQTLGKLIGSTYMYFYDAIAPIISADSIDFNKAFFGSRYGKGGNDYVNCPMNRDEYEKFYDELISADTVLARDFENKKVFEGCMPVEVMAERGKDTLRYGPMKPVGLLDPFTGRQAYAVVQLRAENRERTSFNMVGFQCRLKWPEQKRIFRMIPGLERAEFLRYGSIHRNTFINSPTLLNSDLSLRATDNVFIAGQVSGVEGYLESTAMGMLSGIHAARRLRGLPFLPVPHESAHGSLVHYITDYDGKHFQPSNINLGLFPELEQRIKDKKEKRRLIAERAIDHWNSYISIAFGRDGDARQRA